ncbi:hypothetical protein [Helicobacter saguini]|uniref:hypothetical protein n=1 Tax=Helicobacter saguini TaxID=1548018 RepID=UPI0019257330|nr:hypothetical protein [Helicobacter saguini]
MRIEFKKITRTPKIVDITKSGCELENLQDFSIKKDSKKLQNLQDSNKDSNKNHNFIESQNIESTPESITLKGELTRLDSKLVKFSGTLSGSLNLICVKSGEEFSKNITQDLVLYFADGIYKMQSQSEIDLDVIEFFDGFIDIDFVLNSEIESIRLDYNIKE